MTRNEHLAYLTRLHILKQLLTEDQKQLLSGMYQDLLIVYFTLVVSKIEFDVKNLSYDLIASSSDSSVKQLTKFFYKKELIGLIGWLQKIYSFDHVITSNYKTFPATFSNRDLIFSISRDNLTCFFVIDKSLVRYVSYSIDGVNHTIDDNILFKLNTLNDFVNNMPEYYHLDKSLLEMIFIT